MGDTTIEKHAEAIMANVDPEAGVGIGIAELLVLLPLLFNLPCFNAADPEARRRQVERHPNLSRLLLAGQLRKHNQSLTKKQAFAVADSAIDHMVSSSPAELAAFCAACAA